MAEEEIAAARERLEAAKILLAKGMLVDAVNRIYYAAFRAARAVMLSLGREPKTHTGLISEFGLQVVRKGLMPKKYGIILRRSFEARESSDYTILAQFEKQEVEKLFGDVSD
ncbi:MAG: HEPN domain-containing protein, partial [Candidatus Aenigmarchaeota archaeon]|nr:HEPN domain-containing protein [Candidatus Aenigmarchaeota archaeon]